MKILLGGLAFLFLLPQTVLGVTATIFDFDAVFDYYWYRTYDIDPEIGGDVAYDAQGDYDDRYYLRLRKADIELPEPVEDQTESVYAAYYTYDLEDPWTYFGGLWRNPVVTIPPYRLYGAFTWPCDDFWITGMWDPMGLKEAVGQEEIANSSCSDYSRFWEYWVAQDDIYAVPSIANLNHGRTFSVDFVDRDTDDEEWTMYLFQARHSKAYFRWYDAWPGEYNDNCNYAASGNDDYYLLLCQSSIDENLFFAFYKYDMEDEEEEWTYLGSLYEYDQSGDVHSLRGSYYYPSGALWLPTKAICFWELEVDFSELEIDDGIFWDIQSYRQNYRDIKAWSGTCSEWN
ncbi:hypothetical protein JW905_01150 [bacterium]|nr:hypothetical protein [candidate division CSSED10-310 bacterium]